MIHKVTIEKEVTADTPIPNKTINLESYLASGKTLADIKTISVDVKCTGSQWANGGIGINADPSSTEGVWVQEAWNVNTPTVTLKVNGVKWDGLNLMVWGGVAGDEVTFSNLKITY